MFVQYTTIDHYVMVDIGKKYTGKVVSYGNNRIPITTINRDGYAKIAPNVFSKFREEMYVEDEQLVFKIL